MMFKSAVRNVFLNKRRSFLTLLSISVGGAALLLALGFMRATFSGLEANYVSDEGHLQIFNKRYFGTKDLISSGQRIENYQDVVKRLRAIPHVMLVTPRMKFTGVVGNENMSMTMIGRAIIPENEQKIGAGGFFAPLVSGKMLSSKEEEGALIGAGLAQKLGVKPGDYINVLSNTRNGSYNSVTVAVSGIMKYGVEQYNDGRVDLNIAMAQALLDDFSVDKLVILLDDGKYLNAVQTEINDILKQKFPELISRRWYELAYYYQAVKNLYTRLFIFLFVLILGIMILSVVNSVMISVFERFREIGVMRAIGTNRRKVTTMFFLESIVLGFGGWIIGIVLAWIIRHILSQIGIIMPPAPGRTYSYPLSFQILIQDYIVVLFICLSAAMTGGVFPALKAGRIKIVEALKFV